MPYIDPDVVSDETTAAEVILASLAEQIPGWTPSEGHVETALAEAVAIVTATIGQLLRDEARDAFSGFAESILGIYRRAEGVATALSRWDMVDDAGYLIPAGSVVVIDSPDGTPIAFATLGDHQVPAGVTYLDGVPVAAVEPGVDANGLSGPGRAFEQVPGATGVALTTAAAGGTDAEALADFVARAADRARRLHAIPITADDYAALALDHPSVARAMAVNLLDPANPPAGSDPPSSGGHLTVYAIDPDGEALAAPALAELDALLTGGDRPLNVQVHAAAPTYTTVNVAVTVWPEPNADEAAVTAAVETAVRDLLDPARWAYDQNAAGLWRPPTRNAERQITALMVAHRAASTAGVAGVSAATVNAGAAVTLTGFAPLPRAGTVAVSIAA